MPQMPRRCRQRHATEPISRPNASRAATASAASADSAATGVRGRRCSFATGDEAAARKAVEAYYSSETPAQLREAVETARKASPQGALYREIAADLAALEDRRAEQLDHLYEGALIQGGQGAGFFLERLSDLNWTDEERRRLEGLFFRGKAYSKSTEPYTQYLNRQYDSPLLNKYRILFETIPNLLHLL